MSNPDMIVAAMKTIARRIGAARLVGDAETVRVLTEEHSALYTALSATSVVKITTAERFYRS